MNARYASLAYQPVTWSEWSYVATTDTLDTHLIVTDAHTGRQVAHGRTGFGAMVSLPLNVPLCRGCDQAIDNGVCNSCGIVFIEPLTEQLGDPLKGVEHD